MLAVYSASKFFVRGIIQSAGTFGSTNQILFDSIYMQHSSLADMALP